MITLYTLLAYYLFDLNSPTGPYPSSLYLAFQVLNTEVYSSAEVSCLPLTIK